MVAVPIIQIIEQSTSIDPSGHRHQSNPTFGFVQNIGTSPGQQLDFGSVDTSISGQVSNTKCIYARVSNYMGASGIYNLKFFLKNVTAFTAGNYRFLERKSLEFIPNINLSQANSDTPINIPASPNLVGTRSTPFPAGQSSLSGTLDTDVTEYIYLAAFVDTDVPLGLKGGPGAATYRYGLSFDFS